MEYHGKKYLVAPRGNTQWVKNLVAGGAAALVKGGRRQTFHFRSVADEDKPDILKAYLERYKIRVQRFFPLAAGSPSEAFRPLASRYPVFEITP